MSKKKTTTKSKPKNRTIIKISAVLLGIIAVAYVVISIVFGAWNPIEWGREKEKNVMTINARTLTEKEYATRSFHCANNHSNACNMAN